MSKKKRSLRNQEASKSTKDKSLVVYQHEKLGRQVLIRQRPDLTDKQKEFLKIALDLLPSGPWDETTWGIWAQSIKEATARKGKELFMPLRQALTAMDHGPEMKALLPLIGIEKTKHRLCAM